MKKTPSYKTLFDPNFFNKQARCLCYTIPLLFLFSLLTAANAGQGEQYIESYNNLTEMLESRLLFAGQSTNGLIYKDITSTNPVENSVTQADLQGIRDKVWYLLSANIEIQGYQFLVDAADFSVTNREPEKAFPKALRWDGSGNLKLPSLMSGIGTNGGFTKVPSDCVSSGVGISTTNSFTDVPILPVHLLELHQILSRMKLLKLKKQGEWVRNPADPNELNRTEWLNTDGPHYEWPNAIGAATHVVKQGWDSLGVDQPFAWASGIKILDARYVAERHVLYFHRSAPVDTNHFGSVLRFYNYAWNAPGGAFATGGTMPPGIVGQEVWTLWDSRPPDIGVFLLL